MTRYTDTDGASLVRAARQSVSEFLRNGTIAKDAELSSKFSEKAGVFVTINDARGLRGCIGYPMPDSRLYPALSDASVAAATRDPRFTPLNLEELDTITFEVTILTRPEVITADPKEYPARIRIGRDGLIVKSGHHSGLLLPQVASGYGWDAVEFLGQACLKAGLPEDTWKRHDTVIETFQGTIFKEETPNGRIVRA